MKRFQVVSRMLVMSKPLVHSETDSAAEAYQGAQKAAAEGRRDVMINDSHAQLAHTPADFAALHNVR